MDLSQQIPRGRPTVLIRKSLECGNARRRADRFSAPINIVNATCLARGAREIPRPEQIISVFAACARDESLRNHVFVIARRKDEPPLPTKPDFYRSFLIFSCAKRQQASQA